MSITAKGRIFFNFAFIPLTAQKDSGKFSGVVNCAAMIAKWRPLPLSLYKRQKIVGIFVKSCCFMYVMTLCRICKAHLL